MGQSKLKNKNSIFVIVICAILLLTSISNPLFAETENENTLEPTEEQYLELRVATIANVEGQNKQVIMDLWAHNITFKGFDVRFSYDSQYIGTSSLETNELTTDETKYFEFTEEFTSSLEYFQISNEEGVIESTISFESPIKTSEHIVDKGDGIGMVVDATSETEGLKIGSMSFQMTEEEFETSWFSLQPGEIAPQTGIYINIDGTHNYQAQSTFRFTQVEGILKGNIYTAPTASLGVYTATVRVYKSEDVLNEGIDWQTLESGKGDNVHDILLGLSAVEEIETNNDGTFEIYLQPGTYDILIDKEGYLDTVYVGIEVETGVTHELEQCKLLAGDMNKDGVINIRDVSLFMSVYSVDSSNVKYEEKYDFNLDKIINIRDQSLLMTNYGKTREIKEEN